MKQYLSIFFSLIFLVLNAYAKATEPSPEPTSTTITSNRLEVEIEDTVNLFTFIENVQVTGQDLDIVCEILKVFSQKEIQNANPGQLGAIDKIIATGNVTLKQENRLIRAGIAIISPIEGTMILEDNPQIEDEDGIVTGHRIVFDKNEKKGRVEGEPKVTLPQFPDFGLTASSPKKS